ncbi:hypothetical protein BJL95_09225 [Methylomonas sp. LWB]|nr:hypothetical protein BJL95_09225 [Methylomonas sp. LWB]
MLGAASGDNPVAIVTLLNQSRRVGTVFVPTRIESKSILCFANAKLILMSGFGPTAVELGVMG